MSLGFIKCTSCPRLSKIMSMQTVGNIRSYISFRKLPQVFGPDQQYLQKDQSGIKSDKQKGAGYFIERRAL